MILSRVVLLVLLGGEGVVSRDSGGGVDGQFGLLILAGLKENERELVGRAAKILEKLGLNRASEELMRCTFSSGRSHHCTLEENDDVAGIEAKKLLVSVRYDGPQTLVILALLRVGMTIMASRVARRWKYDIDGGK